MLQSPSSQSCFRCADAFWATGHRNLWRPEWVGDMGVVQKEAE